MSRHLRYRLEYYLASSALKWIEEHSFEQCVKRNMALARAWFMVDRRRRRISTDNIIMAGITSSRREASDIALEAAANFGLTAVESLKSRSVITADNWQDSIESMIPERTLALLRKPGQGIILISGHIGNWEVAARVVSFLKPVTGITRDAKNPLVNSLMQKYKPSGNFQLTPKHDADPARLLSVLKRGEVLALLADQYAMSYGIQMPFFGHMTSVHKSPALLHLVTKAPVVFGTCIRTAPMKFRFEASEPISYPPTGNREADVRTVLDDLVRRIEQSVRKHPAQYLWAHRRWR